MEQLRPSSWLLEAVTFCCCLDLLEDKAEADPILGDLDGLISEALRFNSVTVCFNFFIVLLSLTSLLLPFLVADFFLLFFVELVVVLLLEIDTISSQEQLLSLLTDELLLDKDLFFDLEDDVDLPLLLLLLFSTESELLAFFDGLADDDVIDDGGGVASVVCLKIAVFVGFI